MDSKTFDQVVKQCAAFASRRRFLGGVGLTALAASLGLAPLGSQSDVDAKKKKKNNNNNKNKNKNNNKKEQCNKNKPCPASLNPCESVSCDKNKCVTSVLANGATCGEDLVCQSGSCVCPDGICIVRVKANSLHDWVGHDDNNDANPINNAFLEFVVGPGNPAMGVGSVKISVTGSERKNLATYQFSGIRLADITTLKYSTYNPSAGNGAGNQNESGYLQFNVDFDKSDTWQKRLTYVPSVNGPVTQDAWKLWDAIDNGNAKWLWSNFNTNWPGEAAQLGSVPKTWAELLADYPDIRIRVTDSFFGIRVGEPYPDGYTENIHEVQMGIEGKLTRFIFSPPS